MVHFEGNDDCPRKELFPNPWYKSTRNVEENVPQLPLELNEQELGMNLFRKKNQSQGNEQGDTSTIDKPSSDEESDGIKRRKPSR